MQSECTFAVRMRKGLLLCHLCLCVLLLMMGCTGDGVQMRQQLEELEQQNRAGEQLLNDSLAEGLVAYFDRHGDANERMRAKYMLGRTYYHLGELPRALETYLEAADCADTTAADCDYKVLSRIHAQSAVIYNLQVQPRSQLKELRLAENYAWKSKDSLQAIECLAQQADAFQFLNNSDSLIIIRELAADKFCEIGREDRAAQTLGVTALTLFDTREMQKAKRYLELYETKSGNVDENGNVSEGREIYYYVKGLYFYHINHIDSAEYFFRKELCEGKDLNNQIAGSKGLQKIYEKKKISDSIAKYANLGYILNDSAYSLSEMQNIQKLQASYNYNHHKQKAEEKAREAQKAYYTIFFLIIVIVAVLIFGSVIAWLWYRHNRTKQQLNEIQYHQTQTQLEQAQSDLMELQEKNENASDLIQKKSKEVESLQAKLAQSLQNQSGRDHANLEDSLVNASITKELTSLLQSNPVQAATQGQMRELRKLVNEFIPNFYTGINSRQTLRPVEYEVCLLIRCHFKPAAISKLMGREEAYISNLRKGILQKAYGIKGSPKELDERIMQII